MPSDLERQAAEMPCPACCEFQDVLIEALSGYCEACGNTVLRWPPLSRECGHRRTDWLISGLQGEISHNPDCVSGRAPDATLEKVLDAAHQTSSVVFLNVLAAIGAYYSGLSKQATPTDAALAALLAASVIPAL